MFICIGFELNIRLNNTIESMIVLPFESKKMCLMLIFYNQNKEYCIFKKYIYDANEKDGYSRNLWNYCDLELSF